MRSDVSDEVLVTRCNSHSGMDLSLLADAVRKGYEEANGSIAVYIVRYIGCMDIFVNHEIVKLALKPSTLDPYTHRSKPRKTSS